MFYYNWLWKTLLLPQLIVVLIYFIIGHLILYINHKNYFEKYKIRKGKISKISYFDLIFNLFINSTLSIIIGILFLQILPTHINPDNFIERNYYIMLIKILQTFIISEFTFYFTHRILHIKFIYKHIHYVHHKYEEPNALSTNYSHPLEFIFSTLPTITIGVLITEMSWKLNCYVWLPIITIKSIFYHSGYKMLFFDPSHHDNHHKMKKYNYSSYKIIDQMFGTYKSY